MKLSERLKGARTGVKEGMSVNDMYSVFKGVVMEVASEVVGLRETGGSKKMECMMMDEIKNAVEWKERAYKKMLQRNLPEEMKARRKLEYKEWKKKVRELIEESKRKVDEEFGRKPSENFSENKKIFWKKVKGAKGGEKSGSVRMRGEDGELVGSGSELKGLWKGYFEQLMNNEAEGEAVVTSMAIEAGRDQVPMPREINRLEAELLQG